MLFKILEFNLIAAFSVIPNLMQSEYYLTRICTGSAHTFYVDR